MVKLCPDDVSIPIGVFRQDPGEPIEQIPLQQIGPEAKGVVVADSRTAAPFLRMSQPVSKHGLALLILDHGDPSIAHMGHFIRFPGKCTRTAEPILAAARMIQLGASSVSRNEPAHKLCIEEVENRVIRLVVFRDEWDTEWSSFSRNPVKTILRMLPELKSSQQDQPVILDLWDRQFVTGKLEKTSPALAQIFIVSLRIALTELQPLMSKSGQAGLYIEPRSDDGRRPDPAYRVVWIAQQDRQSLQATVQTHTSWCCLARHGMKYGLRTTEDSAEGLHLQFKPSTPWLPSSALNSYTVGPFPTGSTRGAILKILKAWGWSAKPVQPRTRSADGQGVLWQILAATKPDSEVYQLAHGDVLITMDEPKKVTGQIQPYDVHASAKTLAILATPKKIEVSGEDPWIAQDPWSTPQKKAKSAASQAVTRMDLEAMEIRMEQKFKTANPKPEVEDVAMGSDDPRIAHIGNRMNQLESQMMQHQQATQLQNAEVQQQLNQVRTHVEQHSASVHSLLDQRFSEQLSEIERIMAKRPKTAE